MKFSHLFYLGIVYLLFLSSCANVVSPSGGPKDAAPPKLTSAKPKNYSVQFSAKQIVLMFDEFVKTSDVSQNLHISPPLPEKPEVIAKKKSVIINLKDSLSANTTYTINLSNIIGDITENNVIKDFNYVFSTGDYLDSLYITGSVMNAENGSSEKDILVGLYLENSDSTLYIKEPYFYTITNSNGQFSIKNLPERVFYLFAFLDKNNNKLYDGEIEMVGFYPNAVETKDSNEQHYNISLFKENITSPKVKEFNEQKTGVIKVSFSKPIRTYQLKHLGDSINTFSFLNTSKDELTILCDDYFSGKYVYELIYDSIIDTLEIRKNAIDSSKDISIYHPILLDVDQIIKPNHSLEIHSSVPFTAFNSDSVLLEEDSIPIKPVAIEKYTKNIYRIKYAWKPEKKYHLTLLPDCIHTIFNKQMDTMHYYFGLGNSENYADLSITMTNDSIQNKNLFYVLKNANGDIIDLGNVSNQEKLTYSLLNPGDYSFDFFDDQNEDQNWTTGNYLKRVLPEPKGQYQEKISLRANWELELSIPMKFYNSVK